MIDLYYLDKTVRKGDLSKIKSLRKFPIWIDIIDITLDEKKNLEKEFKLHPLTSEDLINQNIRIKVEEFNNYIFSVFYGIKKKKEIEKFEIDFILGDNWIITNHKERINTFEEFKINNERLKEKFSQGVDFIFQRLIDKEVDNFFPILEDIDDLIENLEEQISIKPEQKTLRDIIRLKKKIVYLKKMVLPQREKIGFLAKNDYQFISKKSLPYFRDVYDHMIRVSDSVDNYRESIGSSFDSYMSAISNNMNEVMKILSIIATIFLPLGVISGIYGTNFDVLPGQHVLYGFWFMMGIMFLIVSIMLGLFKRRKWI